VGPARVTVESLTPRPGIREHNQGEPDTLRWRNDANDLKATSQALRVLDVSALQTQLSPGSAMPVEIRERLNPPAENSKAKHVLRQSHYSTGFIDSAIFGHVFHD
jgi:hypothetical protein